MYFPILSPEKVCSISKDPIWLAAIGILTVMTVMMLTDSNDAYYISLIVPLNIITH